MHNKVEDYDTQEWASESRSLRRHYDDFRNWVISQTQHNPPDDFPDWDLDDWCDDGSTD